MTGNIEYDKLETKKPGVENNGCSLYVLATVHNSPMLYEKNSLISTLNIWFAFQVLLRNR